MAFSIPNQSDSKVFFLSEKRKKRKVSIPPPHNIPQRWTSEGKGSGGEIKVSWPREVERIEIKVSKSSQKFAGEGGELCGILCCVVRF